MSNDALYRLARRVLTRLEACIDAFNEADDQFDTQEVADYEVHRDHLDWVYDNMEIARNDIEMTLKYLNKEGAGNV